jgi:cytochrome bd ubiquinol oxidase subunit I
MDVTVLALSRRQFALTSSFPIIFRSFTIGLAVWPTLREALHLARGWPALSCQFFRGKIKPAGIRC